MLLEFKTKNFRCFKDEMVFSMIPAPKQKDLNYSILESKIGKKKISALCSAVIYGPNASGKSTIVNAMDAFKHIVLRGNINNCEPFEQFNISSYQLEYIPNISSNSSESVDFEIKFIESDLLFNYKTSIALGSFKESHFERQIKSEILRINDRIVYERENNELSKLTITPINQHLNNKNLNMRLGRIAENSLRPTELFLTNGFKNIISNEIVDIFETWLKEKFLVIVSTNLISTWDPTLLTKKPEGNYYASSTLNKSLEIFKQSASRIGYVKEQNNALRIVSFIDDVDNGYVPSSYFESFGTMRFLNEFPLVLKVLKTGGILVVDKFDASIHPIAFMNLIKIFHNDEINTKHAQLIFNTHNPIFLNADLFRRDEIKFVEKDSKTSSVHYSLSDFKTKDGVRKGEDYMKNYFVSKYGAIQDVDFSQIINDYIKAKDTDNKI